MSHRWCQQDKVYGHPHNGTCLYYRPLVPHRVLSLLHILLHCQEQELALESVYDHCLHREDCLHHLWHCVHGPPPL